MSQVSVRSRAQFVMSQLYQGGCQGGSTLNDIGRAGGGKPGGLIIKYGFLSLNDAVLRHWILSMLLARGSHRKTESRGLQLDSLKLKARFHYWRERGGVENALHRHVKMLTQESGNCPNGSDFLYISFILSLYPSFPHLLPISPPVFRSPSFYFFPSLSAICFIQLFILMIPGC